MTSSQKVQHYRSLIASHCPIANNNNSNSMNLDQRSPRLNVCFNEAANVVIQITRVGDRGLWYTPKEYHAMRQRDRSILHLSKNGCFIESDEHCSYGLGSFSSRRQKAARRCALHDDNVDSDRQQQENQSPIHHRERISSMHPAVAKGDRYEIQHASSEDCCSAQQEQCRFSDRYQETQYSSRKDALIALIEKNKALAKLRRDRT